MVEEVGVRPDASLSSRPSSSVSTGLRTMVCIGQMMLRRGLTYRIEWLFGVLQGLIYLWVQVAIWQALLGGQAATSADGTTVTASDMVTYVAIATVLRSLVRAGISWDMEGRLRNGDIVGDLVRPASFPFIVIGRSLGETAASLLQRTFPALVLAQLIWGLKPPASLEAALACVIATLIGVALAYALDYLLGILGFWVWSVQHFEWLLGTLIRVLSGAMIPYWFLPDWLRAIGQALPFHVMGYTPVGLYLGKVSPTETWLLFASALVWTVGLWVLAVFSWRRAIQRLVVQGG